MVVDDLKLASQLAHAKTLYIIMLIRLIQAYTRSLPLVCVMLDLINRAAIRVEAGILRISLRISSLNLNEKYRTFV